MAEWFTTYYETRYADLLYRNHDEAEAQHLIDGLLTLLQPEAGAAMLDLACGFGRYSVYLADKGYDVTGVDIARYRIGAALKYEHDRLHFYQHDMRLPFRIQYFDFVFNFFTSFGYFRHERDNDRALKSVYRGLKPGGIFVMDFLNPSPILARLPESGAKQVEEVSFHWTKRLEGEFIVKTITATEDGRDFQYEEWVHAFDRVALERLFVKAGFELLHCFGNYDLEPWSEASPRTILIARKP